MNPIGFKGTGLLFIYLTILSSQAAADRFYVKSWSQLETTVNWKAIQCVKRLPEETEGVSQLLQTGQRLEDSRFYYLMTRMGINHQEYFSRHPRIIELLENPKANRHQIILSLTHSMAESFVDAVEATRYRFTREVLDSFDISWNFDDYIVTTHKQRAGLFFGSPGPLLMTTETLEEHCRSVMELLQQSRQKDNPDARMDTIATGNYLVKMIGITHRYYAWCRDTFFASDTLFDSSAAPLKQLATFVSYMVVRNQFSWLEIILLTVQSTLNPSHAALRS